jgi:hypothetical protein
MKNRRDCLGLILMATWLNKGWEVHDYHSCRNLDQHECRAVKQNLWHYVYSQWNFMEDSRIINFNESQFLIVSKLWNFSLVPYHCLWLAPGVWFGNQIYWTLTTHNYKYGLFSHCSTHFINHYKTH